MKKIATILIPVLFLTLNTFAFDKKENKVGVIYWRGDTRQNKIALTFDDGPEMPYTLQILDILKEYNVKATFFLIGKNVERYPQIARRIVQEGHSIGNHTYSHPELLVSTKRYIKYQIKKAEKVIFEKTGVKPKLFRPPYGLVNPKVLSQAESLGYVVVGWSVSGKNGRGEPKFDKIVNWVLLSTQNGSIILLHDGNRLAKNVNRAQTVKALPLIIKELKERGFEFVRVEELLNLNE